MHAVMGTVTVSCNSDDFDPPLCWDMQESDELEYEIPEDGRMRLGYNGIWLSFYEDNTYEVLKSDLQIVRLRSISGSCCRAVTEQ